MRERAVSYTHLDVYKRQGLVLPRSRDWYYSILGFVTFLLFFNAIGLSQYQVTCVIQDGLVSSFRFKIYCLNGNCYLCKRILDCAPGTSQHKRQVKQLLGVSVCVAFHVWCQLNQEYPGWSCKVVLQQRSIYYTF